MLILQAAFARAYSQTDNGLSDMLPIANRIVAEYPAAALVSFSADGRRAPEELSIYTNRTVAPLDGLPSTIAEDRPKILALFQEKNTPTPTLPPAWHQLDSVYRKGSAWHFLLLPSR